MGCKLRGDDNVIQMRQLKYGQIAVVVYGEYTGHIVIATRAGFRAIGGPSEGDCWSADCKTVVRILQPGELIEVV